MKMILRNDIASKRKYEEVPDEDLWEDGELDYMQVCTKLYNRIVVDGDWILMRRVQNGKG